MGRKEPAKGIHTSPKKAGRKNVCVDDFTKDKESDGLMWKLLEAYEHGNAKAKEYKGLWTEEQFAFEVSDYFRFCAEKDLKPNKAGLRTWLSVSRSQYYDWETDKTGKYGFKSDILVKANSMMEDSYIQRGEKYPTMNTFLLKTSHGHIEASKVDITTNGQTINSADEVKDLVGKLGLTKK
jgi:hypothetical protein